MAAHISTVAVPYQAPEGRGRSRHDRTLRTAPPFVRAWYNRNAGSDMRHRCRAHGGGDSVHMHLDVDVHARYATDPDRSAVRIRPLETGSNAIPIAVDPSSGQARIKAEPSSRRGGEGSR